MDYHEFNCLPNEKRAELVGQQGRFLAIRTVTSCSVALFHMGGFFAEVWYSMEDNQIALVHGFQNQKFLEDYLDQIDLEDFMV